MISFLLVCYRFHQMCSDFSLLANEIFPLSGRFLKKDLLLTALMTSPLRQSQCYSIFWAKSSSWISNSVILRWRTCIPTRLSISKFSIFIVSEDGKWIYWSFSYEAVPSEDAVSDDFHYFSIILLSGSSFYIHGWSSSC